MTANAPGQAPASTQAPAAGTGLQTADVDVSSATGTPVYPGVYYTPYAGRQSGPVTAPCVASVVDPVQATGLDGQLANTETATGSTAQEPSEPLGSAPGRR